VCAVCCYGNLTVVYTEGSAAVEGWTVTEFDYHKLKISHRSSEKVASFIVCCVLSQCNTPTQLCWAIFKKQTIYVLLKILINIMVLKQ